MVKRKKLKRGIKGQLVEGRILKQVTEKNPKAWVHRFKQYKFSLGQPADLMMLAKGFAALMEVKATKIDHIAKGNIRKKQIKDLKRFQRLSKYHYGVLIFYYSKKRKYVIVSIRKIKQLKGNITYEKAIALGVEVKSWRKIKYYVKKSDKR